MRTWQRYDARHAGVTLAAGEGPYALAVALPEAATHPRVAEALAAPVLTVCGALEALALTLDAAEAARSLDAPQLRPEGLGGPGVARVTLAPEVPPQAPGVVRVDSRAE